MRKIFPHFTIFLYTSSSLRRKADVKLRLYRIESAPSLALNPAIKLTFQQVTWRTMRALISCLLNICIPQLAIYLTAPLNHMSPTPNSTGAPRDATLRNAGEILVQPDHKLSSMPYEEDVLVLGIYWLSTFNCAWVIVSFHNCHFHVAGLEYLRLCQTGISRRILHS